MPVAMPRRAMLLLALLTATACADAPSAPRDGPALDPDSRQAIVSGALPRFGDWLARRMRHDAVPALAAWPVLAGAGDIAECYEGAPPPLPTASVDALGSPAAATARLLDRIPGTVVTLGDNAYEIGSPFDYAACYHPTWGRHRWRTRPAAGNHEYMTPGALGYFGYFPERSAPPLGYYSYDVGAWHVVVLNSTPQVYACYPPEVTEVIRDPRWPAPQLAELPQSPAAGRLCAGDVAQQAWLVADLAANAGGSSTRCTAVYFHHPRFSSGMHGNHYQMQRVWDVMYAFGVDVVLSAHDHHYERFAPQDPEGNVDAAHGIRELLVGTGGADLRAVTTRVANSEVVIDDTYGVLALGLGREGYAWAFVTTDGSVRDAGTERCHEAP